MTPAERNQSQAFKLLKREGTKYTNIPEDRGGPTKFGITMATLQSYRQRPVTHKDVMELTAGEAIEIYITVYMNRPGFSKIINDDIFELCVDSAVQHGVSRAKRWLQASVGLIPADGIIGPITLASVNGGDQQAIYDMLIKIRQDFYAAIIANDPSQVKFEEGWKNRMAEFENRVVVSPPKPPEKEIVCPSLPASSVSYPNSTSRKPNWPWLRWQV